MNFTMDVPYNPTEYKEINQRFFDTNRENFTNNSSFSQNLFPPAYSSIDSFKSLSEFGESEDLLTEGASKGFDMPGIMFGSVLAGLQKDVSNEVSQSNLVKAEQGNGPNGHAFDAPLHAQQQVNQDSFFSNIRSAEIVAGSAFGPEGLVAGLGAALLTTGIQQFFQPNENTTQATSGDLVNAANE